MKMKKSQLFRLIETLLVEEEVMKDVEADDEDLESLMKNLTGNLKSTPESDAIYIHATSIMKNPEFQKVMSELQPAVKAAGDIQTKAFEKVSRSMDTAMVALRNGKIRDAKENFEFALEDAKDIGRLANVDALEQGIQAILKGFEPGKQAEVVKDVFAQFQDIAAESTIAQYLNAMKQDLKYYENASLVSTALIAATDSFRDKNNKRAVKQLMTAFTSLGDLPDSAGRRNAFLTLTKLMSLAQGQIPPKDEDQQQKLANSLNKNKDAIVSNKEKEEIETELKKEIPDQDKRAATKKVTPSKVETFQASIGMPEDQQTGEWKDPTNTAWKKWLDDNEAKLIQLAREKGVISESLNHYIYESLNSRSLRLIIEMTEDEYKVKIRAAKTDATKLLALFKDEAGEQTFGTKLTGLQNLVNATDKVTVDAKSDTDSAKKDDKSGQKQSKTKEGYASYLDPKDGFDKFNVAIGKDKSKLSASVSDVRLDKIPVKYLNYTQDGKIFFDDPDTPYKTLDAAIEDEKTRSGKAISKDENGRPFVSGTSFDYYMQPINTPGDGYGGHLLIDGSNMNYKIKGYVLVRDEEGAVFFVPRAGTYTK